MQLKKEQIEIIKLLSGGSVCAKLPCGFGKSLIFVNLAKTTNLRILVIEPLRAITSNQLDILSKKSFGFKSDFVDGRRSLDEKHEVIEGFNSGNIQLLYSTPETASYWREKLSPDLIVYDEADSILSYGDFRASMVNCLEAFGDVKALFLSATFTNKDYSLFKGHYPKLIFYEKDEPRKNVLIEHLFTNSATGSFLSRLIGGQTVIFVRTRAQADRLKLELNYANFITESYHSKKKDREEIEQRFQDGEIEVLITTAALNRGFNSFFQNLIIATVPSSINELKQQIGRVGRNNMLAKCYIVHDELDMYRVAQVRKIPVEKIVSFMSHIQLIKQV